MWINTCDDRDILCLQYVFFQINHINHQCSYIAKFSFAQKCKFNTIFSVQFGRCPESVISSPHRDTWNRMSCGVVCVEASTCLTKPESKIWKFKKNVPNSLSEMKLMNVAPLRIWPDALLLQFLFCVWFPKMRWNSESVWVEADSTNGNYKMGIYLWRTFLRA